MVSCSRGSRSRGPVCAFCKVRSAEALCDYPYRGRKAGQFCEGKLCKECAFAIPGQQDQHLCPPHKRERDKADEWLAGIAKPLPQIDVDVGTGKVSASQADAVPGEDKCTCPSSGRWPHYGDPQCPEHRVDSDALDAMFPDWERFGERTDEVVTISDVGVDAAISAAVDKLFAPREGPKVTETSGEIRGTSKATDAFRASMRKAVESNDPWHEEFVRPAKELGENVERTQRIESHDFDGDTCKRCGTQGYPDGTVEGTCAELLQAQVNMYGCRPCPKCDNRYRAPVNRDVVETMVKGERVRTCKLTCDGCGATSIAVYVELSEDFGLGYHVEAWIDEPTEKVNEDIVRRLREQMATPPRTPAPRDVDDPAINRRATISDKVAHVKSAKQTRAHGCHWPGCKRQVAPAYWGCTEHWYKLPADIRRRIWAAYDPGQEDTLSPSESYLEVADEAQRWIRDYVALSESTSGEPRKTRDSWNW